MRLAGGTYIDIDVNKAHVQGNSGDCAGMACAPGVAGGVCGPAGYNHYVVREGVTMCELYVKADPILYESRSRSLRICGVVTTLRLENQFWDILSEIAEGWHDHQSAGGQVIEEVMDYRGEVVNFASFPWVSCTRYLSQGRGRVCLRPVSTCCPGPPCARFEALD